MGYVKGRPRKAAPPLDYFFRLLTLRKISPPRIKSTNPTAMIDFNSIRNIVTRGYSRLGIFSAKLIAVMLATAVMTIACMAAGYLIGLIFSGPGVESFDANTVKILLCQLAVMLAEGALFYAISTVLQKTGGSIAVCLVLPMVLTIVLTLADTALAEKDISLSAYWLERISGTLSSFDVKSADMKKALLTALGYFVVTSAGSFLAVMKREY